MSSEQSGWLLHVGSARIRGRKHRSYDSTAFEHFCYIQFRALYSYFEAPNTMPSFKSLSHRHCQFISAIDSGEKDNVHPLPSSRESWTRYSWKWLSVPWFPAANEALDLHVRTLADSLSPPGEPTTLSPMCDPGETRRGRSPNRSWYASAYRCGGCRYSVRHKRQQQRKGSGVKLHRRYAGLRYQESIRRAWLYTHMNTILGGTVQYRCLTLRLCRDEG